MQPIRYAGTIMASNPMNRYKIKPPASKAFPIPNQSQVQQIPPEGPRSAASKPEERGTPYWNPTCSAVLDFLAINGMIWLAWKRALCRLEVSPVEHEELQRMADDRDYCEGFLRNKTRAMGWMIKNTTLSLSKVQAHRYWTVVTHAFSHLDLNHLSSNLILFAIVSDVFCTTRGVGMGITRIVGLTLSSAIFTGAFSLARKRNELRESAGMGASGVSMSCATAAACVAPSQVMISVGPVFIRL